MIIRFVKFETDPDTLQSSITDIIELGESQDPKITRRRMMTQFGRLLDEMLRGDTDTGHITITREGE